MGPDLIADNGADLHELILRDPEFKHLQEKLLGATEETTTGANRLREDFSSEQWPTLIINDTLSKRIIENRFGVGSSVVESIAHATNVMLHGKKVVVIGYGYCGSGVAQRFRGMGAHVTVVDTNPLTRLEAHLEGFYTADLVKTLTDADFVVSVVGRDNVLTGEHFSLMKDQVIIANAGHFQREVDVPALLALSDLSLAYDIRKAREGCRRTEQYEYEGHDTYNIYGVELLWPLILIQLALFRRSMAYIEVNKKQLSLMYSFEHILEAALKKLMPESWEDLIRTAKCASDSDFRSIESNLDSRCCYFANLQPKLGMSFATGGVLIVHAKNTGFIAVQRQRFTMLINIMTCGFKVRKRGFRFDEQKLHDFTGCVINVDQCGAGWSSAFKPVMIAAIDLYQFARTRTPVTWLRDPCGAELQADITIEPLQR